MEKHGFRRIVLATDGSEQSGAAVALAACFAQPTGATARVVHVWNLEVHNRHGVWDVEIRSEAERLIRQAVDELRAEHVDADGEIVRADSKHVASAVAQVARQFQADLVVLGSRGLSDWQSMINHSVSHELLTKVDCPVLIARGGSEVPPSLSRKVLVAVAGGDDIEPSVRAAIAAASTPGSRVLVLHVAQALFSAMGSAYVETDNEIHETMGRAVAMLKAAGIRAETTVAEPGPVARIVAATASQWRADVIVIGSSRMGDLGSLLFGSVTHGLMRASDRPLLVAERVKA